MEISQNISKAKLEKKIGKKLDVIVDSIEPDGATCRTMADAPEIDGNLFIDENFQNLSTGDIVQVVIDEASEYDLWGKLIV
jgi:ribosomal protein S12 methylthiotransferase